MKRWKLAALAAAMALSVAVAGAGTFPSWVEHVAIRIQNLEQALPEGRRAAFLDDLQGLLVEYEKHVTRDAALESGLTVP